MKNETLVDITSFNPQFKNGLVFSMYEGLKEGERFILIDEQDPHLLQQQFNELDIREFDWQYLERGPKFWRVRIIKNKPKNKSTEHTNCCCKHNVS